MNKHESTERFLLFFIGDDPSESDSISFQMMKFLLCLLVLFVGNTLATTDLECKKKSNTSCEECLKIKDCAYCDDKKLCLLYSPSFETPCDTKYLHVQTCFGRDLSIKTREVS